MCSCDEHHSVHPGELNGARVDVLWKPSPKAPMNTTSKVQSQVAIPQSTSKTGINDVYLSLAIVTIPVVLIVSILLRRRHKAVKQRRQVETLERMWKLPHHEKTP